METNFCVKLDAARSSKLQIHLATQNLKGRKFIENVVDNLASVQAALDVTVATPRKRK